jgi:hypothetical protein
MPETKPILEGQLNASERAFISKAILAAPVKPEVVLEAGIWLGGGSTLHILRTLPANGTGHFWGVEAAGDICEKMIENLRLGALEAVDRFTPIFGFSTEGLPEWLNRLPPGREMNAVFLDGGPNPVERIEEFKRLADRIKLGGIRMAHDALTRKGKWFVPFLARLDNWEMQVFDLSNYGLLHARKIKPRPPAASLKAAGRKSRRMRLEPVEPVGRFMPGWLCGLILRLRPKKLARMLTVGED